MFRRTIIKLPVEDVLSAETAAVLSILEPSLWRAHWEAFSGRRVRCHTEFWSISVKKVLSVSKNVKRNSSYFLSWCEITWSCPKLRARYTEFQVKKRSGLVISRNIFTTLMRLFKRLLRQCHAQVFIPLKLFHIGTIISSYEISCSEDNRWLHNLGFYGSVVSHIKHFLESVEKAPLVWGDRNETFRIWHKMQRLESQYVNLIIVRVPSSQRSMVVASCGALPLATWLFLWRTPTLSGQLPSSRIDLKVLLGMFFLTNQTLIDTSPELDPELILIAPSQLSVCLGTFFNKLNAVGAGVYILNSPEA